MLAIMKSSILAVTVAAASVIPIQQATTFSQLALNAQVSGTSVTASTTVSASKQTIAANFGICVRDSSGANADFALSTNVVIATTGTSVTKVKSFAKGTYSYGPCVQASGSWVNVGASKVFTVAGTASAPTTTVPVPTTPAPTTSVSPPTTPAPTTAPPTTSTPAPTTPVSPPTTSAPATSTQAPATTSPATQTLNPMSGIAIPGTHLAYESQADLDHEMTLVAASGSKWLRFDVAATQIEATSGVRYWTNIDRVVASALAHGLTPLGVLTTLPAWAASTWYTGATTAAQRTAFASFAQAAAAHFAGKIGYWEVWNEPNNPTFWQNPSIANYTLLLKAAYPAIKAGSPSVKVLMGGTAGGQSAPNNTETWLTGLYANGGKAYFDCANIHPYPDGGTATVNPSSGEMSHIAHLRTTMAANGDSAKVIFGTETGFPTAGANSTSEAGQATLVTGLFAYWKTATGSQQGPLFVYTLRDLPGAADREAWFGLVRNDFSVKPAFAALTAVNAAATGH